MIDSQSMRKSNRTGRQPGRGSARSGASLVAPWVTCSTMILATLALPLPLKATATEQTPDLFLVAGRDWRIVLPVSVLAARQDPPAPVLLPEEHKEPWFEHFIERYAPTRPALIELEASDEAYPMALPWEEGPPFPEIDGAAPEPLRLSAGAETFALILAKRFVPPPEEEKAGPPVWLVDSADYRFGLLSAVAAGAEGGVLIPVGPGEHGIEAAVDFAASRRSPLRFADAAPDDVQGQPASLTRAAVLLAASKRELEVDTITGVPEITRRASHAFSKAGGDLPPHVVITNPSDTEGRFSPPHLSLMAPLFAIARNAPLVLTSGRPDDLERDLEEFEKKYGDVSHVTLIGDYLGIRMREMLDPDQVHEGKEDPRVFKVPSLGGMVDLEPSEYAVGRLAAQDAHDLSLQIGRILAPRRALGSVERPALMLANADEIFVMAELVSMATVQEMENVGWEVSAHYGDTIDRELIFEEMPGKEVVVWTGHPRDLTVDYDIGIVDQRLDASLVFLQGCYTLDRSDPYVLAQQGAAGVIGTYMAVYSASGSAFAKTILDAMLYFGADQGEAMMHARNYLLSYVAMKKKRGHREWRKTWRAALSFDLWGDPTAVTVPPRRSPKMAPARLMHEGDTLRFDVPTGRFPKIAAGRYTLETAPAGQLGAIYTRSDRWGDERRMQPFYFGWVDLPDRDTEPALQTEIPDNEWVSLWTPHRRRLYLMVHNRAEQSVGREALVFRFLPDETEVDPEAEVSARKEDGQTE